MFSVPPDAPTSFIRLDTAHRNALYTLTGPETLERVLVIGPGGGADVLTAKRFGARRVDAVEINPTTTRIVRDRYAAFTWHLFSRDGVTLYNEDGRSFAARALDRYDAIVLFAVDSLTASSTGAYVLVENYLYTSEAFTRYWQLLSDRGLLQISRWYYPEAPRETLRVFTMAYETLSAQGIGDPGLHIAVIGDASGSTPFADVVLSKLPLTPTDAAALTQFARANHFSIVYLHPTIVREAPAAPNAFYRFAAAHAAGRSAEFYAGYQFNVAPVTDDRPFFFSYRRWSDVLSHRLLPSVKYYEDLLGTKPYVLLVTLVLQSAFLVFLLVFWPISRRRGGGSVRRAGWLFLGFFALIGIAFMFIEITLIQRFVLLVGHPIYSMSVSLPGILVGAAVGSYVSGRGRMTPGRRVGSAVTGIVLGILALGFSQGGLERLVLPWPLAGRLVAVSLITGGFGVLMGIPFPTAVATLARRPQLIPLGWTVNGGTSVIASVLAIPVAMSWGFSTVLAIAGACYLAAWPLFVMGANRLIRELPP